MSCSQLIQLIGGNLINGAASQVYQSFSPNHLQNRFAFVLQYPLEILFTN